MQKVPVRTCGRAFAVRTIKVFSRGFQFISVSNIQEKLKSDIAGKDYAVIDVREPENFILSHIPNAINFPHEILVNSTSDYILAHIAQYCRLLQLETSTANIPPIVLPPQLIFHCRLSLIRGPESASRVEKALDDLKRIGRKNKIQNELKYALDYVDELVTLEESKRLTLLRDSEKLWDEVVWNESLANTRVYLLTGGYKAWLKRDGEKSDEDS